MDKCPFCKGTSGFYRHMTMTGKTDYYYNFDNTVGDNNQMHDGLRYRESKSIFCSDCHKKLTISKTLANDNRDATRIQNS